MGTAKLYSQSGGSGFKINGIIEDYYVYAGETVEKGDFVELLTGSNGAETETQVRKATTSDIYGVAKTSGMGAYKTIEYTIPEGESVSKGENREYVVETLVEGDIIPKTWTEVTKGTKYVAEDGTTITATNYNTVYSTRTLDKGFDGDTSTNYESDSDGTDLEVVLKFPYQVKINKMKNSIVAHTGSTYTISGSNDGSVYTQIGTGTESSRTLTEATIDTPDFYYYYKFIANGESSSIYEVQVSECEVKTSYTGTALQSGTAGQTIQIAVPVSDEESTGHKDVVSIYTVEKPNPINLVVNGDFSDGLEGWRSGNTPKTTLTLENGYLKTTVTTASSIYVFSAVNDNAISIDSTHIYYGAVDLKISSSVASDVTASLFGNPTDTYAIKDNNWHTLSLYGNPSATATSWNPYVMEKDSAVVGDVVYIDNMKVYDLTEIYGAGNEPTQEWCDANL